MNIELGQRTEETVAVYFERAQNAAIRAVLPQRARTLEEALADYRRTLEPGASSFGRTILADGQYVGDVWCYAMDPSGDPQAMVSYCVFEQALWGRGVASEALGLFLEEIRERFGLERIGAFTFIANQGPSGCWRRTASCWRRRWWRKGRPPGTTRNPLFHKIDT